MIKISCLARSNGGVFCLFTASVRTVVCQRASSRCKPMLYPLPYDPMKELQGLKSSMERWQSGEMWNSPPRSPVKYGGPIRVSPPTTPSTCTDLQINALHSTNSLDSHGNISVPNVKAFHMRQQLETQGTATAHYHYVGVDKQEYGSAHLFYPSPSGYRGN